MHVRGLMDRDAWEWSGEELLQAHRVVPCSLLCARRRRISLADFVLAHPFSFGSMHTSPSLRRHHLVEALLGWVSVFVSLCRGQGRDVVAKHNRTQQILDLMESTRSFFPHPTHTHTHKHGQDRSHTRTTTTAMGGGGGGAGKADAISYYTASGVS